MRFVRVLSSLVLAAVVLVACTTGGSDVTSAPAATSSESYPARAGCGGSGDDLAALADEVWFGGQRYERVYTSRLYIREDQLGAPLGVVDCDRTVVGVDESDAGDNVGVWELAGFERSFRLVAGWPEGRVLYEAWAFEVTTLREVYGDLDDLVVAIDINSEVDGETTLGYIDDPTLVRELVGDLLDSSVHEKFGGEGLRYFLELEFADAPPSRQVLLVESGRVHSGVKVPARFVQAIVDAVAARQATTTTAAAPTNTWALPTSPTRGEELADAFLTLPGVAELVPFLHLEATGETRRAFFTAGDIESIEVSYRFEPDGFDPEDVYGQPAEVFANTIASDGTPVIPDGTTIFGVVVSELALHVVGVDPAGNVVEVIVGRSGPDLALARIGSDHVVEWVVALLERARDEDWSA